MDTGNIFHHIPDLLSRELVEKMIQGGAFHLERIVSQGQTTPEGKWYDQERDEWVILLKGSAVIKFESQKKLIHLAPGSYMNIPAHVKHRVESTDQKEETVWLALHYDANRNSDERVLYE